MRGIIASLDCKKDPVLLKRCPCTGAPTEVIDVSESFEGLQVSSGSLHMQHNRHFDQTSTHRLSASSRKEGLRWNGAPKVSHKRKERQCPCSS